MPNVCTHVVKFAGRPPARYPCATFSGFSRVADAQTSLAPRGQLTSVRGAGIRQFLHFRGIRAVERLVLGVVVEGRRRGIVREGFRRGAYDEDDIASACLDATIAKTLAELHWEHPVNRRFVEQISRPAENATREET